jgi:hypothetical protein
MRPLAIDLYCGLGGWTDGLLAEGFRVIGFDIEEHVYGEHRYPAQLVIQDVLALHGSQFKDAALIVASPPCQEFSYMAMPWKRAKQIARALRGEDEFPEGYRGSRTIAELTRLFDACFRIQREACDAAGRHIPLVVENVKGAQPWVGKARWSFGSFYLWGDVPALMPATVAAQKNPGFRFDGSGRSFQSESVERHTDASGYKSSGLNWSDPTKRGQDFTRRAGEHAIKNNGGSWFAIAHNTTSGKGQNPDGRKFTLAKQGARKQTRDPVASSHGKARKFASAMIAKIPEPLSRHVAAVFRPDLERAVA